MGFYYWHSSVAHLAPCGTHRRATRVTSSPSVRNDGAGEWGTGEWGAGEWGAGEWKCVSSAWQMGSSLET